jgi:hypothetical protein
VSFLAKNIERMGQKANGFNLSAYANGIYSYIAICFDKPGYARDTAKGE